MPKFTLYRSEISQTEVEAHDLRQALQIGRQLPHGYWSLTDINVSEQAPVARAPFSRTLR